MSQTRKPWVLLEEISTGTKKETEWKGFKLKVELMKYTFEKEVDSDFHIQIVIYETNELNARSRIVQEFHRKKS